MGVILKLEKNPKYCQHESVVLNEITRVVECEDCDQIIDPFEYLVGIARNQLNLFEWKKKLERDRQNLFEEIEELKKEKQSLKQGIRRMSKK